MNTKICIVGVGLLGGSFALGLRDKLPGVYIYGIDAKPQHAEKALSLGIIDEISTPEKAVPLCELTVLAIPVNLIAEQIHHYLDLLPTESVLVDLGSTKQLICQQADLHPKRGRYVALHPIAGTEFSGPEAAFANLLPSKIMIMCDVEKSAPSAYHYVKLLCQVLAMRIEFMGSAEHDKHLAYVSHLSHVLSFALSATVLDKEKDEKSIFAMAGSGFSSTVRLAKSSPAMWAPIFIQNRANLLEALENYISKLQQFKTIIANNDEQASRALMSHANEIRRVLEGIEKK